MTADGASVIIDIAASSPQLVPVTVTNSASPVVIVRALTLVRLAAKRYSFQAKNPTQNAGHRQARRRQRNDDMAQHASQARAVDHRGIVQLNRYAVNDALQQPDCKGQVKGRSTTESSRSAYRKASSPPMRKVRVNMMKSGSKKGGRRRHAVGDQPEENIVAPGQLVTR